MAGGGQTGEKTEEATPRKKQESRKQGVVAKSVDLTGALVMLTLMGVMPVAVHQFGGAMLQSFQAGIYATPRSLETGEVMLYVLLLAKPALIFFLTISGAALTVGLVANFAQVGFVFSTEALQPKFQKINPIEGLKRILSARSLVEGLKAFAKGLLFGWIAYSAIQASWPQIIRLGWYSPIDSATQVGSLIITIGMRIGTAWLVLAAADYFFQKKQTNKQIMMTKDELKREMKEQEGSPEVKSARFQRMRKLIKSNAREAVRKADVIITNPTHFSVAIQYDRSSMHAPMVVAKGQDYLALKIREMANEFDVPILPNPPLARALYRQCEVGDFIPRDMFSAVAEVLAYVYRTIKKVR
ncbi:MAG: flagellar biosynthesis protein FlhB [Armatimonadetes bacterium]|nr:flagellar biosynthesis protein FlhB [Armatimonadota bacterium]